MVLRISGSSTAVVSKSVRFVDQKLVPKHGTFYFFEENLLAFMSNVDSPRWADSLNLLDSLTVS
jgi:hypothetical protein